MPNRTLSQDTRAILAAWIVFMFALIGIGGTPSPQFVTFTWDYPPDELSTNLVFNLYRSKTPTVTNSWVLQITLPGTVTNASVLIDPTGNNYFILKSSNTWWQAESDPSNVALVPPFPRSGVLSVKRGSGQ